MPREKFFVVILIDFLVDNKQQHAISYCLQHKKKDLLEVLLVKGAEYYPVCPLFLIVLIMRLIFHRGY